MTNIRAHACQTLLAILEAKQPFATLLKKQLALTPVQDRGLLQELVYGTLRYYHQLLFISQQLLHKPIKAEDQNLLVLILIGLYQLRMTRIPAHASIHETVSATSALKKPWAKGMVNAVLREYQRQYAALETKIQTNEVAFYSHPHWIIQELKTHYDSWQTLLTANNDYPPMTLRINSQKISRADYLKELLKKDIAAHTGTYSDTSITLERSVDVQTLPGFNEGLCSVQDEAAQLCTTLLDLKPSLHILDACAAPGGKAGAIFEQAPDATLTVLDANEHRMQRLRENLERLSIPARALCADATDLNCWWDQIAFDRILLDAPCSGSGVIRRHPDIKLLRKPADIEKLASLQTQLLHALWKTLKVGGRLVYATCSVFPQENREIIKAFLHDMPSAQLIPIESPWGIDTGFGRQLLPQAQGHDGFFYSVLKKTT